jgi:Flp pilus assembly protein TadG
MSAAPPKPENRPSCRARAGHRGVVAIEYAIILPVLLVFVLGLIDAGRVLWTQATLNHAAEAAARCGAISANGCATEDGIKAYAVERAAGLSVQPSAFSVSVETCGKKVTASYSLRLTLPWGGNSDITLEASACYPM